MAARSGWAAGLVLCACARPDATLPRPPAPPRPAAAETPSPAADTTAVDPAALPIIPVAATGEPTVELYAQDVLVDWLALHLADGPILAPATSAGITGRLLAPSRKAALEALPGYGGSLDALDLKGTRRRVDLALARMPAPELALFLAELLGDDIITTVENVPVTVLVREAPADGVLRALATAIGARLRREEGIWILERREAATPPPRRRRTARARVELRLDDANATAVADLLRVVVKLGDPRCAIARPISARLRHAPVDIVATVLLDGADWVGPWCRTHHWDGSELSARPRLAGIALSGRRSAALLWNDGYWMVVKPDPDFADVVIGPTSIGIRQKNWGWEGALAAPALPAELPGSRDFVGEWRLAATLRDGPVWRALLVGDAGAVWVSSAEKDRVLAIEAGKVVLPPDREGEPPITLRLRRAK